MFDFLLVSWISCMFLPRCLLHFAFSLTIMAMFSMVSSAPKILSSISCIPLVLACITPDLFPHFSISSVVSFCDFFIYPISIFKSWIVLFTSFICLVVFSCNYLRDVCASSLRSSACLPVFSCISLRGLFMSFLLGIYFNYI